VSAITEDTIELERRIGAPPDVVFSYFTDPERYRLWQGNDAELDPRPGGAFRVTISGRTRTVVRGRFVVVDPPRRIVVTWGWEQVDWYLDGMRIPPGGTTVEIVLVADGDGTILRLRHSGLSTEAIRQFHTWGWDLSLDRLSVVAAGGDPGPDPFADL
jgi:uncharacterized protein YndB with AHSA1/START domain